MATLASVLPGFDAGEAALGNLAAPPDALTQLPDLSALAGPIAAPVAAASSGILASVEYDLNEVWANSLGLLWSAVSGTIDPWTAANLAADNPTGAAAGASFASSIGGNPSQFWQGVLGSISPANIFGNLVNLATGNASGGSDIGPAIAPAGGPTTPGGKAAPSWLTDLLWIAGGLVVALIALGFAWR